MESILSSKEAVHVGYTPLHLAVEEGHKATVKLLLDAGAILDEEDDNGFTPLIRSANDGYAEIVRLLIDGGADPNKANKNNIG